MSMLSEQVSELEKLAFDLYCLAFPKSVSWEISSEIYDKYSPCELCEKAHCGKSPCANTSKDLTDECCNPFQAVVVADRMQKLGLDVG